MRQALILAVLVALCATATATAATPAQYKAKVNGICRSSTPKFKKLEATMAKAEKAGNMTAYGLALGQFLVAGLTQDAQILKTPVPVALHRQMTPILTLLKKVDSNVRAALKDAGASDPVGMTVQLAAVNKVAAELNRRFDAAGLRDCGSDQG